MTKIFNKIVEILEPCQRVGQGCCKAKAEVKVEVELGLRLRPTGTLRRKRQFTVADKKAASGSQP
jgi:hypothetical protein